MSFYRLMFVCVAFTLCLAAQETQPPSGPLTDQRIVELVRAGVRADELVRIIATASDVSFNLAPAATDEMLKAGVSESTIKAMAAREGGVVAVAPAQSNPAVFRSEPVGPAEPITAPLPVIDSPVKQPLRAASALKPGNSDALRLTDEQVTQAIQRGFEPHRTIGLRLNDIQTSMTGRCSNCNHASGFTIYIYTPEQWIEMQAARARNELRPYSLSDVSDDMRQPFLHVTALPSAPDYLNAGGFAHSSSVKRVVLCDTSKQTVIQPIDFTHGMVEMNSALRSANLSSGSASFPMTDVEKLRAGDPKREFFVVIIGDRQDKWFKVKEKFKF